MPPRTDQIASQSRHDHLNIWAGQVRNLKPMDEIEVRERKTKKLSRITLNKACVEAVKALLASEPRAKTSSSAANVEPF